MDSTIKFCLDDGTQLTPLYDTEAETLKNHPPELSPEDAVLELASYLKSTILRPGESALIRFDQIQGFTPKQISEHIEGAAKKAGCTVTEKTPTRAMVRRNLGGVLA